MKFTILIPIFLVVACQVQKKEEPYIDDVILEDTSDYHKLRANSHAVTASLNLSENKQKEITVRYITIADKKNVPVTILHLPSAAVTEAKNKNGAFMHRERVILQFIDTLRKTFSSHCSKKDSSSSKYSEVFSILCAQLKALAERRAIIKRIYLYSDLQENSSLFSCYTAKGRQLLKKDPDSIARKFRSAVLLPASLKGVTLYLINEPTSRENDENYSRLVFIYRKALEPLGLVILQHAQNSSF